MGEVFLVLKRFRNSKEKFDFWFGAVTVLVVAFLSRFYLLDLKSLHHDEAVNGWFVTEMWRLGFFKYDPTNYHGPLHFYLLQGVDLISGGLTLAKVRWIPALFSVATVGLGFFFWRKQPLAAFSFALLSCFSMGMIFFGRSGIHEAGFAFFQVLMAFAIHEFLERDRIKGICCFVVGLVGSLLLKETFIFPVVAFFLAAVLFYFGSLFKTQVRWFDDDEIRVGKRWLLGGFFVWFLFFSGFFQNLKGPIDFFVAYFPWAKTGMAETGHEKSPLYFIELLGRYETVALVLFSVGILSLKWLKVSTRFMIFVAGFQLLVYSLIPYKTPWCILSILVFVHLAVALMLQDLGDRWLQSSKLKGLSVGIGIVFLISVLIPLKEVLRLNYWTPLSHDHKYVYVQSTDQLTQFLKTVEEALKNDSALKARSVEIYAKEAWPFPWALRDFHKLSFLPMDKAISFQSRPLLVLAEGEIAEKIEADLPDRYIKTPLIVRDGMAPLNVYWDAEVFTK